MMETVLKAAKLLLLAALFVLLWGILHGSPRQADFDVLLGHVEAACDLTGLKQGDAQLLRRLYGLNGGDLERWVLYTAEDNMAVEELLLVKCYSVDQAEQVRQAAEERAKTQKNSFEGYGPEQVRLLNDRVIQVEDTYVLFVVSQEARQVKDAFVRELYPHG